jgi:hypothetical protein
MSNAIAEQTTGASVSSLAPICEYRATVVLDGAVRIGGASRPIAYSVEFPEELNYDGIVVLTPGFGGFKQFTEAERQAHAQRGFAALSYAADRSAANIRESLLTPQTIHSDTIAAIVKDLPNHTRLRRIPNAQSIDFGRLLLSPHSMGGLAANAFALRHRSQVDAIINKATVGYGSPTAASLLQKNHLATATELIGYFGISSTEQIVRNIVQFWSHYGRNAPRTIGEAASCLTQQSFLNNRQLHAEGVKQAYLGFAKDDVVPPSPVEKSAKGYFDAFRILSNMSHVAPQTHPLEVAQAVHELYAEMA